MKIPNLDEAARQKKLASTEHHIMTVEVNAEAKKLKTCCIHSKPTSDTATFATDTVHMEPNEWWQAISRLEVQARQLTLKHFECKKIWKEVKKGKAVSVPVCLLAFDEMLGKHIWSVCYHSQ